MKKPGEAVGIMAPMALEQAWQEVLTKFADESVHDGFIEKCIVSNNVLFASQKYRQLLEANPTDEISIKMRDRIIQRVSAIYLTRVPGQETQVGYSIGVKILFFVFGIGIMIAILGLMIPDGTIILATGAIAAVVSAALFFISQRT
jgi:hypothetical protein